MVLSTPLDAGPWWHRSRVPAPVLVGTDGGYAALPSWSDQDDGVTLSADGTKVAWWTNTDRHLVVHLLTLSTGEQVDVDLPPFAVTGATWVGYEFAVAAHPFVDGRVPDRRARTWLLNSDTGAVRVRCTCAPQRLGMTPKGKLAGGVQALTVPDRSWEGGTMGNVAWATEPLRPGESRREVGDVGSEPLPVDPARSRSLRSASVVATSSRLELRLVGYGHDDRLPLGEPVPDQATVLGWSKAGVLVQVSTADGRSLRWVDPRNGSATVVSSAGRAAGVPVAVAADLAGLPRASPATPPRVDAWDRAHLAQLAERGLPGAGALLLVVLFVVAVRYRRRRP
jgi:hypothetical protein